LRRTRDSPRRAPYRNVATNSSPPTIENSTLSRESCPAFWVRKASSDSVAVRVTVVRSHIWPTKPSGEVPVHRAQAPSVAGATAYPKSAVLPGITRAAVIKLAKADGIEIKLQSIDINQLLEADEIFLTNSIMQVMPVCRIERKAIGQDKPGPMAQKLSAHFAELVKRELL